MAETLEVIFRNGWTFFGTALLIFCFGWALSMPFYWWYKMKQINMSRSYWLHDYGN